MGLTGFGLSFPVPLAIRNRSTLPEHGIFCSLAVSALNLLKNILSLKKTATIWLI